MGCFENAVLYSQTDSGVKNTKVNQSYLGLALEIALRIKNLSLKGFRPLV